MSSVLETQEHAANKREQTNKEASGARTQREQANTETTAREQRGGGARAHKTHARKNMHARARPSARAKGNAQKTDKQTRQTRSKDNADGALGPNNKNKTAPKKRRCQPEGNTKKKSATHGTE